MSATPRPLLIYGLQPLLNPSFEADASGVEPPSSWDSSASVNGRNQVNSLAAISAGDGLPSVRGLLQNTTSGTAGNQAILRQRLDVQNLPTWVKTADGVIPTIELCVAAMFKPVAPKAAGNAYLDVLQYSGGGATTTPGTGTPYATPKTRAFQFGEADWSLRVFSFGLYDQAKYIDVRLVYDIARAGYDAGANAYWDRLLVGFLCELSRGFSQFDLKSDDGYSVNEGDGIAEVVKIRRPRTQIDVDALNVMDGSDDDTAMKQFVRWQGGSAPGMLALWLDREEHVNASGHFQKCFRDPSCDVKYPKGVLRRAYSFRFIAPSEGAA